MQKGLSSHIINCTSGFCVQILTVTCLMFQSFDVSSPQTPRYQVTCAPRMEHWSPRRRQGQGPGWLLFMSSKPGPSGPLAPPWQPVYAAWSPPTSASRFAVSHCSGTTSCFTTASSAWGSEERGPLTVITLVGRWRGNLGRSCGAALWSPQILTLCFWSGSEGNNAWNS